MRELHSTPNTRLFAFWGSRVFVTKGELKFVVHPAGGRVPLFHVPDDPEMVLDRRGQFTDDPDSPIPEIDRLYSGSGMDGIEVRSERGGDAEFVDDEEYNEYQDAEDDEAPNSEPDDLGEDLDDEEEPEEGGDPED
jgi:hypothetical protein